MKIHSVVALVGLAMSFVLPTFAQEKDTGVVVTAANAFLATLSNSQLAAMKYDYTLANAEVWSNIPITIAAGNGLKLGGLTSSQLTPALAHILAHHCATGAREDRYRGLG